MTQHNASTSIADIVKIAADGLRDGTLTLKDVIGLTPVEINAVRKLAAQHERRGDPATALKLHSTLGACDPYNAAHWKAMGALHTKLNSPAGALVCYEALAAIRGRDAESARLQADCVEQLGFGEVAKQIRREAHTLPGAQEQNAERLGNLRP